MKKIVFDRLKDKYFKKNVEIITHDGKTITGVYDSDIYYMGIIRIGTEEVLIKDIKSINFLKDNTIYKYVVVTYEDDDFGREYSYKTTINNIKPGDIVLVDRQGQEVSAEVIEVNLYTRDTAPYPVEKTKDIISIINHSEDEEDEDEEYNQNEYVLSDDYEYTFNDIEQKVFDKLKELHLSDKKALRIILMLRTNYNSSKQCEKMLGFLDCYSYDQNPIELEKYARLLANEENYYNYCVKCPVCDNKYISIIDCLENSDEDIWNSSDKNFNKTPYDVDFEKDDVCKNCKWHNPVIEDKSYLCKDPIMFTGLTEDIIKKLEYNDIIAISVAESGAMGCPGNIEVVTYRNNKFLGYDTNPMFGGVPYYKLYKAVPWLEKFRCALDCVENVGEGWKHIDTGFGNHLLVRDALYDDLNELSKGKTKGEIYNSWKQWIVEVAPKIQPVDYADFIKPKIENESVFDYLDKNLVMDWLPKEFSLSPFKHAKQGEFIFADGMIETCFNVEIDNDILEQLKSMTNLMQDDILSSNCRLVDDYYSSNPNCHIIGTIDTFLSWIRENSDNIDGKLLYKWGAMMMLSGREIETVKIGIAILGLFNLTEEDNIIEPIKKLALSDEFTLYCDIALSNLKDINDLRFELAKKIYGYGKVHIVPKIEVTSEKIETWLFLRGCENQAGNNWLALDIANKIDLAKVLDKADMTVGTLNALHNLLDGFIDTENFSIDSYKDLYKFIDSILEKQNVLTKKDIFNEWQIIEYSELLCMIIDLINIIDGDKNYIKKIKELVNTEKVKNTLLSEIEKGKTVDKIIYISSYIDGINIYDSVYKIFEKNLTENKEDEAYRLVEYLMSNKDKLHDILDTIRANMTFKDDIGNPEPIICLDDINIVSVIQGLRDYPLEGLDFIEYGLRSKYMYPRHASIQTIQAWIDTQDKPVKDYLPVDLYATLLELKDKEIIKQYKIDINNILKLEEDLSNYRDPKVSYYSKDMKKTNSSSLVNLFDGNIDNLFSYNIIVRGHKYFLDKMVYNVVKNNNLYIGYVQGSNPIDEYKVTIKIDNNNDIISMSCTCPYESNCKHEYATILYIRNDK